MSGHLYPTIPAAISDLIPVPQKSQASCLADAYLLVTKDYPRDQESAQKAMIISLFKKIAPPPANAQSPQIDPFIPEILDAFSAIRRAERKRPWYDRLADK